MTTETTGEPAAAPEIDRPTGAPDVKRATDKVRDKRTGEVRPRKSNAGRKPKSRTATLEAEADAVAAPSAEDVQGAALLAATAWGIAGPMVGCRALSDVEAMRLGGALAPVLKKYLPAMAEWQVEINLAVCLYVTFQETKVRTAPASTAEIVDDGSVTVDLGG